MTNPDIEAYIASRMRGHPAEQIVAMREFLSTSAAGRPLADWHSALTAILALDGPERSASSARRDAAPMPPPADRETEVRLVRSWMEVGTRLAGQVFFGA